MSTDPLTNNSYLVTPETIEHFLMHMLRDEHLFNVGLTHLDQTFLNRPDEAPYGIIWKTAREYHGQFHRRPSGESLSSMVMSRLPLYGRVKQEDVDKLASVLGFIYDTPDSQLDPTLALEYLKAFLRDRRLGDRMEQELQRRRYGAPDYRTLTGEQQQILRDIDAIGGDRQVPTVAAGLADYQCRTERTRGRPIIGLRTGLRILDERLCGIRGLILLGAAPGMGKTVFCCQIASGVCRHSVESGNDACVLFLSLDMNSDELLDRLHCCLALMDWKTYKLGSESLGRHPEGPHFTEGHQQQLAQAAQRIEEWGIGQRLSIRGRDEVGTLTAAKIATLAAALKHQTGTHHCLIIVDYLQLLDVDKDAAKQGSDLEADKYRIRVAQQVLDASKDAAGQITDSLIAISEARKPTASRGRTTWGSKVEDLMGSARLGYAADAVLLLRGMTSQELVRAYQLGTGTLPVREQLDGQGHGRRPVVSSTVTLPLRERLDRDGISPLMIELAKGRDGMTRGKWAAEFHFRRSMISERDASAAATSPNRVLGQASAPSEHWQQSIDDAVAAAVDVDDDDLDP